jgi:hypothetical protein
MLLFVACESTRLFQAADLRGSRREAKLGEGHVGAADGLGAETMESGSTRK